MFYGHKSAMRFLYGENLKMHQDKKGLIVRFLEMRVALNHQTLSDRLTRSLISAGLVKGITPSSIRKQLGVKIPDTALWPLDGGDVE